MERLINIVSFNIPWPANYGGIIDVFYQIKALHECGVKIILHCFEYERPHSPELESICEQVFYYKRRTGLISNFSFFPYNVISRKDPQLLQNLLLNNDPILFEGLHSCYYITHKQLSKRIKIHREANIEHDYYNQLAKAEPNLLKKCFFRVEALRFRFYQKVLRKANLILAVSSTDADYLKHCFPSTHVEFMPCFNPNEKINIKSGQSDFILYHGKLSVSENTIAALFLIREVFCKLPYTCIIAGMNPPKLLYKAAQPFSNIRIEANPSETKMNELTQEAQINLLITFQATGLKLKLLNSLFTGRHIIVNRKMISGTGLESLCNIANTPEEMIHECISLMQENISDKTADKREKILFPLYSNQFQAKKLISLINLPD